MPRDKSMPPARPYWDRRWRQILVLGAFAQKDRDALRRALFWQGFGALGAECFVHPRADLPSVLDALLVDGLADLLAGLMPLLAADASLVGTAGNADLVARAWDLRELAQAYTEFVSTYNPVLVELRSDPLAAADEEGAFLLQTVMTLQDTPDDESHDRFPLPRPLPHEGEGRFESRSRLP
jgi:phenylacetic acid degradation operon negative regulatory protein